MTGDALLTSVGVGGTSTYRYLQYGRMGRPWRSGLKGGLKNSSYSWQKTSRFFRGHAAASTQVTSMHDAYVYSRKKQINRYRRW